MRPFVDSVRGRSMRQMRLVIIGLVLSAACSVAGWAGDGVVALQTADPACPDDSGNIYVDCGNGTVTDNRSGLVWLKDADCAGFTDWFTARDFVPAWGTPEADRRATPTVAWKTTHRPESGDFLRRTSCTRCSSVTASPPRTALQRSPTTQATTVGRRAPAASPMSRKSTGDLLPIRLI